MIVWADRLAAIELHVRDDAGKDEEEAWAFKVDQAAEPEDDPSLVLLGDPDAGERHQHHQAQDDDQDNPDEAYSKARTLIGRMDWTKLAAR